MAREITDRAVIEKSQDKTFRDKVNHLKWKDEYFKNQRKLKKISDMFLEEYFIPLCRDYIKDYNFKEIPNTNPQDVMTFTNNESKLVFYLENEYPLQIHYRLEDTHGSHQGHFVVHPDGDFEEVINGVFSRFKG